MKKFLAVCPVGNGDPIKGLVQEGIRRRQSHCMRQITALTRLFNVLFYGRLYYRTCYPSALIDHLEKYVYGPSKGMQLNDVKTTSF